MSDKKVRPFDAVLPEHKVSEYESELILSLNTQATACDRDVLKKEVSTSTGDTPFKRAQKPSRKSIISAPPDRSLKSPRIVFSGLHKKPILCAAVLGLPKVDSLLFSSSEDKTIGVWSLRSGKLVTILRGHDQRVSCLVSYSAEGIDPIVISGSWDESVRVWPLKSCFANSTTRFDYKDDCQVLLGHTNRINAIAIARPASNDPLIVSGGADNTIHVWAIRNTEIVYRFQDVLNVTWVLSLATYYDPETHTTLAISGCKDNSVRIWKLPSRARSDPEDMVRPVRVITGHTSRVHSIAFFENECNPKSFESQRADKAGANLLRREVVEWKARNPMIITACRDLDLRIWSVTSGQLIRSLQGHTATITCVAVHPLVTDGLKTNAFIISSTVEGKICIWDFASGELIRMLTGHYLECTMVMTFEAVDRPGDMVIVSTSKDMTMRTWLYMEEKSLLNRTFESRLNAIAMYCDGANNTICFTGNDDGGIQAENIMPQKAGESFGTSGWRIKDAHAARVRTLAMYVPLTNGSLSSESLENSSIVDLTEPLLISGGRDNKIRVTDISNGEQVAWYMEGHTEDVTSVRVFAGAPKTVTTEEILPFIVTGGYHCKGVVAGGLQVYENFLWPWTGCHWSGHYTLSHQVGFETETKQDVGAENHNEICGSQCREWAIHCQQCR